MQKSVATYDYLKGRAKQLLRKFGLTIEDYQAMLAEQGGGCALCGETGKGPLSLHVDHDHTTGTIRGLLCNRCNTVIVAVVENEWWLVERAQDYLAKTSRGTAERGQESASK